jgi:hypothetical protein
VQITPDFKARKESKIPRRNKAKTKDAKQQQIRPIGKNKKRERKRTRQKPFSKNAHITKRVIARKPPGKHSTSVQRDIHADKSRDRISRSKETNPPAAPEQELGSGGEDSNADL